jgi:hypothetical protein
MCDAGTRTWKQIPSYKIAPGHPSLRSACRKREFSLAKSISISRPIEHGFMEETTERIALCTEMSQSENVENLPTTRQMNPRSRIQVTAHCENSHTLATKEHGAEGKRTAFLASQRSAPKNGRLHLPETPRLTAPFPAKPIAQIAGDANRTPMAKLVAQRQ